MVEYALLTAGTSLHMLVADVTARLASVNWLLVGAIVVGLFTVKLLLTPKY